MWNALPTSLTMSVCLLFSPRKILQSSKFQPLKTGTISSLLKPLRELMRDNKFIIIMLPPLSMSPFSVLALILKPEMKPLTRSPTLR